MYYFIVIAELFFIYYNFFNGIADIVFTESKHIIEDLWTPTSLTLI